MNYKNRPIFKYFDKYYLDKSCQNSYTYGCVFGVSKADICPAISYMPEYDISVLIRWFQQYLCQRINETEILRNLPNEFSKTLSVHMKKRGYSTQTLAMHSLVSERTIQRMLNSEGHNTSINTIIAVCIGLKLPPLYSFDLLRKSGCWFKRTPEHVGYMAILLSHHQCDIYECNGILSQQNIPILGNKEFF